MPSVKSCRQLQHQWQISTIDSIKDLYVIVAIVVAIQLKFYNHSNFVVAYQSKLYIT